MAKKKLLHHTTKNVNKGKRPQPYDPGEVWRMVPKIKGRKTHFGRQQKKLDSIIFHTADGLALLLIRNPDIAGMHYSVSRQDGSKMNMTKLRGTSLRIHGHAEAITASGQRVQLPYRKTSRLARRLKTVINNIDLD
jgi:hypothetical protein